MHRRVFVQRSVSSRSIIVAGVAAQHASKMRPAKDNDVVQAFTANGPNQSFGIPVLPRRMGHLYSVIRCQMSLRCCPARRRACIEHIRRELSVSERRACAVLGQHRSTQGKPPRGRDDEERLTADIIALARQYGRYGYRKVAALLIDAGWLSMPSGSSGSDGVKGSKFLADSPNAGDYG